MMQKNGSNSSLQYRQELRYRIIRAAMPMFKRHGVRAVRMDDVASALSISKRTLYEVYANKEVLLLECVRQDNDDMLKRLQDYSMTAENELDVCVTYFRIKFADLDAITPLFLTELERYPDVMRYIALYHEEQRRKSAEFIRKCVENGFFVPDINYDVIQQLCESTMEMVIAKRLYDKFPLREIFHNFFIVLLRGFCTEKGLTLLDQYLRKTGL